MMNPLAAIHVGKKQLALDDDTYRALLERVTGKRSSKDMTPAELAAVLEDMRRLGFDPAPLAAGGRSPARRATGRYAAKLQALWIAAWNLGVVRNRDDAAMLAFVERQTGIAHTRFLGNAEDAKKAIEALKKWLAREGQVDWSPRKGAADHVNLPQYRIATAQWMKLIALGAVRPFGPPPDLVSLETGYARGVTGLAGFVFYSATDWITLMNALGAKLRAAPEAGRRGTGRGMSPADRLATEILADNANRRAIARKSRGGGR